MENISTVLKIKKYGYFAFYLFKPVTFYLQTTKILDKSRKIKPAAYLSLILKITWKKS